MPAPTREEMRLGIVFVVASIFLFALGNAIEMAPAAAHRYDRSP